MLKIFNTLTRKEEEFKPLKDDKVTFYHCGPTVYWVQHLGNMRAMVLADLMRRSLEYLGYNVKFVRNYTDVGHLTSDEDTGEDKLEKGARRENKTPQEIAEKYIKIFENDLNDLNVLEAQVKPRATEHIPEIIEMVKNLLDKGYAYATDLAIYFDVAKVKDYTKLSGQILEKNLAQAGKGEVEDTRKKNPADFALWFFKAGVYKNALQTWLSPFKSPLVRNGEGFPGWHIECSAMARKYLGNTLDFHMGGVDHIPVHHTNEIAQSEAANGVKFVNYWLHNEHLIAKSERISKSAGIEKAGNGLPEYCLGTLKEKGYDPLALRYFFLNSHYRSKQNFTWDALKSAETSLNKLRDKIIKFKSQIGSSEKNKDEEEKEFNKKFTMAIEDDFNIPRALAVLWEVIKTDDLENKSKLDLIFNFDKIFGLKLEETREEKVIIPPEVEKLVEERKKARKKKDWAESDRIRKLISGMGFNIEDTAQGQKIVKN